MGKAESETVLQNLRLQVSGRETRKVDLKVQNELRKFGLPSRWDLNEEWMVDFSNLALQDTGTLIDYLNDKFSKQPRFEFPEYLTFLRETIFKDIERVEMLLVLAEPQMFAKKFETGHRDLANLLAHRQKLLSQELDDLKNKASVFNHEDHWYVAHNLKFELAFNLAKEGLLTNPMEMDKISQDDSFYFPPALEAEDVFKTYYTFVCGLEECNPSNKLSVRELYEQVCLGLASYMFLAAKEARRADNDFLTAASVAYADWLVEIDCRFLKSLQEQEFNWKRSAANFQIPELLKPELVPVLDATRRQRIIERGEENNV